MPGNNLQPVKQIDDSADFNASANATAEPDESEAALSAGLKSADPGRPNVSSDVFAAGTANDANTMASTTRRIRCWRAISMN